MAVELNSGGIKDDASGFLSKTCKGGVSGFSKSAEGVAQGS
jgi:hypothetical protein